MSSTTRSTHTPLSSSTSVSPLKRKAMSITQTYYLAHTARGKLSSEAARSDHNLRLLVGHANLLDSLMLDLAEAEQEQESWFNQSVRKASKLEEPRHIQWSEDIMEEPEQDWQAEDADDSSDSSSEYDSDEEMDTDFTSLQRVSSRTIITTTVMEVEEEDFSEEEEFEDDEEENMESLQLQRTNSHSLQPPALDHDSDESSEDEQMPPSPPNNALPSFSEKSQFYTNVASSTSSIPPSEQAAFFEEGYYLPQRSQAIPAY